jgi:hypothetical protein
MNSYSFGLAVHNGMRWVVLSLGLFVILSTLIGWLRGRAWGAGDERLHSAFVGFVDLQFLAGLILYAFLSPLPQAFFAELPATMKVPTIRFFMLDHPVSMFIAIAIIHGARNASKRASGSRRFRIVSLTTALALTIMLASIPWPGLRYGRPLVRTPDSAAPAAAPVVSE